ncbi:MAG TPA: hypothetical protein VFF75_09000 [Methylophilaceae bacterium]|nr:hypothetical protein [Methylophilaceae bacterium]
MALNEVFLASGDDWHLSGLSFADIRPNYFDVLCTDIKNVTQTELDQLKKEGKEFYIGALSKGGKPWLLEPLKELQPKSHAVLQEHASDYMVGFHWYSSRGPFEQDKDSLSISSFFVVHERVISIRPPINTYEDEHLLEEFHCKKSLLALPDVLARSWLWRAGGWAIHSSLPGSVMINRQLIGYPSGQWQSIGKLLRSFNREWEKKYLKVVQQQIPDAVVTHLNPHDGSSSEWHSLRCFLDTRPEGLNGPYGDQFLVVDEHTDQVVYHIHNGDIKNLRILNNPGEAIDAYCAHTLLRIPGRFDFMPWSEPINSR